MFSHKQYNSNTWDRPISYHSYNARVSRPYVLDNKDQETDTVRQILSKHNVTLPDNQHLARNIAFEDIEIGKRRFDHNSPHHITEWFIHQWKKTNDLGTEHPTGSHKVYDNFASFVQ